MRYVARRLGMSSRLFGPIYLANWQLGTTECYVSTLAKPSGFTIVTFATVPDAELAIMDYLSAPKSLRRWDIVPQVEYDMDLLAWPSGMETRPWA